MNTARGAKVHRIALSMAAAALGPVAWSALSQPGPRRWIG